MKALPYIKGEELLTNKLIDMRVQTQSVHFVADRKLLQFIDKKVNKLDNFYDRIIDADVILRLEKTGRVQDKVAEIKIQVPGDTIIAKEISKTFEGSVDGAVGALRKQLIKHKEKLNHR